jgi:hypothetical protein
VNRDNIIRMARKGGKMKDTIRFWGDQSATEVLRLSAEGIWANPDIPADDAAKLVLAAIEYNIKVLVQKAVEAEREECAKIAFNAKTYSQAAKDIRARGEK